MDIIVGLLCVAVGLAVCLSGLRLFFFMLPIWGFVSGFFTGAGLVTALFGDGFLSTTLGIVVGLVVAVVFSVFAYLYWYIGALLAAGSVGALVGAGLMTTFGVDSGWIVFLVAVIVGAAFLVAAIAYRLPIFVVAVSTSLSGAAVAIAGLLLILDRIDRTDLGEAAVWQKLDENWILWILWMVAAAIGLSVQFATARETELPGDKWVKAVPQTL